MYFSTCLCFIIATRVLLYACVALFLPILIACTISWHAVLSTYHAVLPVCVALPLMLCYWLVLLHYRSCCVIYLYCTVTHAVLSTCVVCCIIDTNSQCDIYLCCIIVNHADIYLCRIFYCHSCCVIYLCCITTHVMLLLYVYNCVALPLMGCIIVDYTVSFTCVVLYWRSCCTIALLMSSCHACCAICLLVLYYFHSLVMLRYLYCLSLMLWYLIGTHACCALSPCVCERTCPLCAPLCVCHCPRVCARLPHLTSLHITPHHLTPHHLTHLTSLCVRLPPCVCARTYPLA